MTGNSQHKAIQISQVDTFFANGVYPIEFLFFYSKPIETTRIRAALGEIAADFWPAFGRYEDGTIVREDYDERNHFSEVNMDQDYEPSAPAVEIHNGYCGINPAVDAKLFFLTVLHLRNGTLLIPKMNHLVGDGYSFFYLLSALAAVTKNSRSLLKRSVMRRLFRPMHQRTALREFHFSMKNLRPIESSDFQTEHVEVPKKEIETSLREVTAEETGRMSANDLLSAKAVKRILTKTGASIGDTYSLTVPIDVRKAVKSYGQSFFGNGLLLHAISFATRELVEMSDREAAHAIRESMPKISQELYEEYLRRIESWIEEGRSELLGPYDPETGCLVTNLTKLPVTRLDFGTGMPDHVFPLTVGRNSAAVLDEGESYTLRLIY